jgi:LuxR family maltose regulon positive regulatory protein
MPRFARIQLRWSEQAQNYILFMGDPASEQVLSSDRLDWLEQVASFSFHCRSGMHYTVRKQKVQRGNDYWYAYRRLHGRIVKRYLGRMADLTLARLEDVARLLESVFASHQSSLSSVHAVALSQSTPHISCVENVEFPAPVAPLPLLLSKLSPPRLHTLLLDRSRLFALLDAGRECALTLLSAPAGFGKTTLVGQWMTARRASPDFPPVAWVSLETADNDPMRFWRYLIAACQTFQIDLAQVHGALTAMNPQPPFVPSSLEAMLTILLNALAQCPSGGILVLEDYHVIAEHAIHETVAFFLDHLPVTVHLIIITRSDPPFSLARLRARNLLYEVRTADLRFSQEESAMLLQQVHPFSCRAATLEVAQADNHHRGSHGQLQGLRPYDLDTSTMQRLHAQLEGWGVGLHLVKLALQRAATQASGEQQLALFSANHASFQEYFVTEVLDQQPEPVQQFVLQTSMLARLTASLCDAVIEQQNSQDMLSLLERANLFLEPLDAAGQR